MFGRDGRAGLALTRSPSLIQVQAKQGMAFAHVDSRIKPLVGVKIMVRLRVKNTTVGVSYKQSRRWSVPRLVHEPVK